MQHQICPKSFFQKYIILWYNGALTLAYYKGVTPDNVHNLYAMLQNELVLTTCKASTLIHVLQTPAQLSKKPQVLWMCIFKPRSTILWARGPIHKNLTKICLSMKEGGGKVTLLVGLVLEYWRLETQTTLECFINYSAFIGKANINPKKHLNE